MDNLGDLIYIVILGIIVLSGYFNAEKKKKKEREKQKTPPQASGIPDIREILKEYKQQEVQPAKVRETPKKVAPIVKKPEPFLRTSEGKGYQSMNIPATSPNFLQQEEHSINETLNLKDPEEIRKAVIYSEIFNRKYN